MNDQHEIQMSCWFHWSKVPLVNTGYHQLEPFNTIVTVAAVRRVFLQRPAAASAAVSTYFILLKTNQSG